MRRSISRTESRYSVTRLRSLELRPRSKVDTRSSTESRMLRFLLISASRAAESVLSLDPKSRSNTARGLFSIGSGVVGVRHEHVLLYAQLYPILQTPINSFD